MLQLKNIVKDYGNDDSVVNALKGVSVDFRPSEFVSILGPSGCGKTTLLNIIGGLDRYTSGDLIINGKSTKEFKDYDWDTYRNHKIGFVFQSYNLISHLNVVGNVEIALSLSGVSKKERHERALKALEEVGLKDQAKKRPNQLSGGQMQRVAIARALVNNPDIILADEPTGALDSKTSVQVMDILKSISKNKLIIMVTHNSEIAETYSSRIIKMIDGNITHDNNPFTATGEVKTPSNVESETLTKAELKQIKKERKKQERNSAMGYGTALGLSGRNLLSKKGRTFMTSFAGSIGIIGVALVLAISNGFTGYINNMQSNALGSSPITVSAVTINSDKFASLDFEASSSEDYSDKNIIMPYDPMQQLYEYGHYNAFTQNFIKKVNDLQTNDQQKGDNRQFNNIETHYYAPIKLIYKNPSNINYESDPYSVFDELNKVDIMSGSSTQKFYPLLSSHEFILSQYDLICGNMPKIEAGKNYSTDLVLVVGKGNKVDYSTLKLLGFATNNADGSFKQIDFNDIVGKEYKVLYNDDYFIPNSQNYDEITSFSTAYSTTPNGSILATPQTKQELYEKSSTTLKISGILRIKDDATSNPLSTGIAYDQTFRDHYLDNCKNSLIAKKQLENKSDYKFYAPYSLLISATAMPFPFGPYTSVTEINQKLNETFNYTLSNDDAFDLAMQAIGISNTPISFTFYPKTFDAKDTVLNLINEYNNSLENTNQKIIFADTTEFLTNTLGNLINIISYVLIAFASISLIVSSVMIGVLTYASVIERTKEIGVLRSIGARKKDISRVFNSETLIIGFTAGVIGIAISYLFCPIINAIIFAVAGDAISTNIAVLNPLHALVLIAISTLLTMISGLFPASIAAKKDPVKALRTE